MYPQLVCKVNLYCDRVVLIQETRELSFPASGSIGEALPKLFALMDGRKSLDEIQASLGLGNALVPIVQNLQDKGWLIDAMVTVPRYTCNAVREQASRALNQSRRENLFWQLLRGVSEESAISLVCGYALELYHLFSSQYWGHAIALPALGHSSFHHSLEIFRYCTRRQVEDLRRGLAAFGILSVDLADLLPLPSTTALYNGLSFWASADAPFYIAILGAFAERLYQDLEQYWRACESLAIVPLFTAAIKPLLSSEAKAAQTQLRYCDLQEMPPLAEATYQRYIAQAYLLVTLLEGFYGAITQHYATASCQLRRVSAI